jgi:hypothetical protein
MGIKITDLLPIDQASVSDNDVLPIVDLESQATKKITIRKLREGMLAIDNGTLDPNDIESQNGVLLALDPNTGGLSADFNLDKLRTRFFAVGDLTYSPVTGSFTYFTPNSDGIDEGLTHLFYTQERARNAISVNGAGLSYNPASGVISFNVGDPGAVTHVGGFTFDGFTIAVEPAQITGIIQGSTLQIVTVGSGDPTAGMTVTGVGVLPGTTLVAITVPGQPSNDGDLGGVGSVWSISVNHSTQVGSIANPAAFELTEGDFILDPGVNSVKIAGSLKLGDNTVQTTAFPGYTGWTHTDNVGFTTTGIGKKVSLNYGSNSIFVDTTGVSLRGGASAIKVNTSGQLVFPDATTQTTAFNINAIANNSVLFKAGGNVSSSTKLTYANDILSVDTINVKDINFTGSGTVDISSNSNLQISALGTININGAYTIPTTAGQVNKVLKTNGTNAATWEYDGVDSNYVTPSNSTWKLRTYNGGTKIVYAPSTLQNLTVTNAINGSFGSDIYIDQTSYTTASSIPVGARVSGGGLTNALVLTSIEDSVDPNLWKLVVDQTGTFTTSTSFDITWGNTGTGAIAWFDPANSIEGPVDFRGAIIEYHAYCENSGTVIGSVMVGKDGTSVATHRETLVGSNQLSNYSFWVADNNTVKFSGGNYDEVVTIQFTAKVFYGQETYN